MFTVVEWEKIDENCPWIIEKGLLTQNAQTLTHINHYGMCDIVLWKIDVMYGAHKFVLVSLFDDSNIFFPQRWLKKKMENISFTWLLWVFLFTSTWFSVLIFVIFQSCLFHTFYKWLLEAFYLIPLISSLKFSVMNIMEINNKFRHEYFLFISSSVN